MGQQVGEAFVRIRPNMTGFKSETETGVKSSFSNLAKIAGLAFGGAAVGALIKSSVESAAGAQAITKSVSEEFGRMGKAVLDFANKQGAAFGSLTTNTNQTSFALGKLFRNTGDSAQQAALMTTNWEKLALALNQAKGGGVAGAAVALQQLQTVAAGTSTRGLHELGITITNAQIAAKAAADGFIQLGKSTTGLTPAQKQLVTYQLAIKTLPTALREAALVSHGFSAEQARLAVAWDNAKTALGTALLPELTKGATALTNWLNKMERSGRLQHDFNQIAGVTATVVNGIKSVVSSTIHIWEGFTNAVGGSKNALIALASAFALLKVGGIGKAVTKDASSIGSRFTTTFQNIQHRAKEASTKTAADFSGASRKIVSQTEAMKTAGRKWSVQMASDAGKVKSTVGATSTSFGSLNSAIVRSGQTTKTQVGAMNSAFDQFSANTKQQASGFRGAISRASTGAATAFEAAATGMKAAAIEVGVTIKTAIIQTGIGLLVVAIGIAVGYIITHWDTVKRYTIALGAVMTQVWHGVTGIVIGYYKLLGGAFLRFIVGPITNFFGTLAHYAAGLLSFFGFGGVANELNKLSSALGSVSQTGANLLTSGVSSLKQAKDAFANVGQAWTNSLKQTASDPKTKDAAKNAGKTLGTNVAAGATSAITQTVPSVQKAISDALQNAVAAAHKAIENAVQAAKNNLDKIGQDLANTISNIQAKIGGAAGAIAGSPQGKAFEKLKKLIESGAPAFEIQKAQAELAGQLQNVGKTQKQQVSTQLANLTAAFDKGQIGYREFESRLHKILHDDGITMKEALKAGGSAFADAFKAQVRALGAQARAIAALPAKFRGIGGAGGAADIKIIQPLQVIKQEQLKVRTAVEKAAQQAQKQRAAILKQEQKNSVLAQQAAGAGVRVRFVGPGPHGTAPPTAVSHSGQVLSQVRDHTRRAADHLARHRPQGGVTAGQVAALQARVNRLLAKFEEAQQHSSRHTTTLQRQLQVAQEQLRVLKQEQAQSHARSTASRPRPSGPSPIKQAVTSGTAALLRGLREVCTDITQADKDIVAAELGLRSPLENLRRTELRIGDHAAQQRDRQYRATRETNTLLRKLEKAKGVPGFNKEPPGTGSAHARRASAAGVKP